jgi:hypothetical protein
MLASVQVFCAEENSSNHVIYAGVGSAESGNPNESEDTPWSIGYLYKAKSSSVFGGIDFAREGTSLDNTSGKNNEVTQGFSINLILGRDLHFKNDDWSAGIGVLLGARETGESCPDSYLGYACYADADPDTEYDFNYGAVLHLTFKKALIGARLSGESSQLVLGVAF